MVMWRRSGVPVCLNLAGIAYRLDLARHPTLGLLLIVDRVGGGRLRMIGCVLR